MWDSFQIGRGRYSDQPDCFLIAIVEAFLAGYKTADLHRVPSLAGYRAWRLNPQRQGALDFQKQLSLAERLASVQN
jgi:hypothetical protein